MLGDIYNPIDIHRPLHANQAHVTVRLYCDTDNWTSVPVEPSIKDQERRRSEWCERRKRERKKEEGRV
jgi:hypothetical protein